MAKTVRRKEASVPEKRRGALVVAYTRLFKDDVDTLKKIADDRGTKWTTELRLLVRRALKGQLNIIK